MYVFGRSWGGKIYGGSALSQQRYSMNPLYSPFVQMSDP